MQISETCYADPTLFILADESLIESMENATYAICQMDKHGEPIMKPTERWEGGDGKQARPVQSDPIDGTVLYDPHESTFHCWYRTHNIHISKPSVREHSEAPANGSWNCYATSRDGIHWEKPHLGLIAHSQSVANNMFSVAVGPIKQDHLSGIVPNYVEGLEGSLIATCYSHYDDPVYPMGITWLKSDDGFNWDPHYPPVLPLDGDAHCLMYDWHQRCYICTTRSKVHQNEIVRLQLNHGLHHLRNKRHVAIARSRDLVHWTPMTPVIEADDKDPENAQMYHCYVVPYGHGYLGFVQMFYPDPTMTYGPLDIQLVFSRDLNTWQRIGNRTPVLPRGPEGSWDCSHVSLYTSPPHPEGDRLRFWYGGKDTEHWQTGNAAMSTATMRRDGFAGVTAGKDGGTMTTVPMTITWATKPWISADASDGEIRVEILDAKTMEPLEGCTADECLPITGDSTEHTVRFGKRRGNFIRHAGEIRFRFHIKNATLYAFKAHNCVAGVRDREKNAWL